MGKIRMAAFFSGSYFSYFYRLARFALINIGKYRASITVAIGFDIGSGYEATAKTGFTQAYIFTVKRQCFKLLARPLVTGRDFLNTFFTYHATPYIIRKT